MTQVTDANQQKQATAEDINAAVAKQVAELVRSTLGPMGRDKMLVDNSGRTVITNDGATILRETNFVHPTARMIIEVARTQEEECFDGTTTAIIVTGALMREAEELLKKKIHPTMIVKGFRLAMKKCTEVLGNTGFEASNGFLVDVAKTAMTGKSAEDEKDHLAELCVQAADASRPSNIHTMTMYGSPIKDSYAPEGIIVGKQKMHVSMPSQIVKPKIALFDQDLRVMKEYAGVNVQFTNTQQLSEHDEHLKAQLKSIGDKLTAFGANVVLCVKDVDVKLAEYLTRKGFIVVRRVAASNLEAVAEATNAMILSSLDDLEESDLGTCEVIEEVAHDNHIPFLILKGTPNKDASSLVIYGPTEHVAEEIKRAVDDAVGVVWLAKQGGGLIAGGGAPYMTLALSLRDYAASVGGRESLAVESFANALEIIPTTLAENSGLSAIDTLMSLRKAHATGNTHAGLNVDTGEVVDMVEAKVVEPLKVVRQALISATETAAMILRIDNIITAREANEFGE